MKRTCPPNKLLEDVNNVAVIITSVYHDEIYKQLKDLGLPYVFTWNIFQFTRLHNMSIMVKNSVFHYYAPNTGWYRPDIINIINENIGKIEEVRTLISDKESLEIYDEYIKNRKYNYKDYSKLVDENIQYFDLDILSFSDDEVFLDVGCYCGESAVAFANIVNGKFKKIYSFEPSPLLFEQCKRTLAQDKCINGRFEFIPMGVSNISGNGLFDQSKLMLNSNGSLLVELCKIDDKINDNVTFIKMDIEGSELKAIEGAQNIIKAQKPKLAICLYHNIEDLWEIPLYIHELIPEYKFYVRHYSDIFTEFVLFAV